MKSYKVVYFRNRWELHDGTMMEEGEPYPILSHEDKPSLLLKTKKILSNKEGFINIYDKNNNFESVIKIEKQYI